MLSKMNAELKKQFAAVFAVGSVFPFFAFWTFPFVEKFFFLPMESKEKAFCDAVLERLDGDIPILAAVKDKEIPFLNQVRNHNDYHNDDQMPQRSFYRWHLLK